ncbi:AbrB/MazE/SpoVT family DNA-binding domain-containing protein [candidate division KSB1 bacterium]|nr:AbrB/MazE/SpoVT family DNA-binding domain-containing protein [candidate division KSB1 bacterium]TDJ00761.1 MAG: AbrB/MazE/SpoVT family DNA-binding domain-containing protein [Caldithrix sp.]
MLSKVQKWGNSQGIRIPKNLLENSHINVGEEVDITVQEGKIIVESTNKIRGRYDIRDLVSQMPKDYKPKEENWGAPMGREIW